MFVVILFQNTTLRSTGFDVLRANVIFAPEKMTQDERAQALAGWRERLKTIFEEKPVEFVPCELFDANIGFQLSDETIIRLRKDGAYNEDKGLTIGQHLGKVPSGTMMML